MTNAERQTKMNATTNDTPRVWIACLASYNDGILHGEWIDAVDADEIREGIERVLKTSPTPGAEEWAIHDHEGFGSMSDKHPDIDELAELGAAIEEHGEAYRLYADYIGEDYTTVEKFEEDYCGEYDSETAYAEELFDEQYANHIPDHLANYIDYEAFARDLFCGDYFSARGESGLHIFITANGPTYRVLTR